MAHMTTSGPVQMKRAAMYLRRLAWMAVLLLAVSPAAAQVSTSNGELLINTPGGQQLTTTQNQNSQAAISHAPTTGTFCMQEMTATFCNVPTSPNTNGYGSVGGGAGSASASTVSSSPGVTTSSTPPCMRQPVADELCN